MKHLNPRQGITTSASAAALQVLRNECETPKSPPGDYNLIRFCAYPRRGHISSVKHLNPRQGITTVAIALAARAGGSAARVKHLNPRQGITTWGSRKRGSSEKVFGWCETPKSPPGDYNQIVLPLRSTRLLMCETPKSPPGDYNLRCARICTKARH